MLSIATANKAVVQRLYADVWNNGNLQRLEELFHADAINHERNAPDGYGLTHQQQAAITFHQSFPDCCFTIEHLVAEDDKVVAHLAVRATFAHPWFDIPPNGKKISLTGMALYRFSDGKIAEVWSNWDELGFRQQLEDA